MIIVGICIHRFSTVCCSLHEFIHLFLCKNLCTKHDASVIRTLKGWKACCYSLAVGMRRLCTAPCTRYLFFGCCCWITFPPSQLAASSARPQSSHLVATPWNSTKRTTWTWSTQKMTRTASAQGNIVSKTLCALPHHASHLHPPAFPHSPRCTSVLPAAKTSFPSQATTDSQFLFYFYKPCHKLPVRSLQRRIDVSIISSVSTVNSVGSVECPDCCRSLFNCEWKKNVCGSWRSRWTCSNGGCEAKNGGSCPGRVRWRHSQRIVWDGRTYMRHQ